MYLATLEDNQDARQLALHRMSRAEASPARQGRRQLQPEGVHQENASGIPSARRRFGSSPRSTKRRRRIFTSGNRGRSTARATRGRRGAGSSGAEHEASCGGGCSSSKPVEVLEPPSLRAEFRDRVRVGEAVFANAGPGFGSGSTATSRQRRRLSFAAAVTGPRLPPARAARRFRRAVRRRSCVRATSYYQAFLAA